MLTGMLGIKQNKAIHITFLHVSREENRVDPGQRIWIYIVFKTGYNLSKNLFFVLSDLILYVPSTIFQLNRDGSSWVEPVLS